MLLSLEDEFLKYLAGVCDAQANELLGFGMKATAMSSRQICDVPQGESV